MLGQHPMQIPSDVTLGGWEKLVLSIGRFWWKITGFLTLPFLISAFYSLAVPLLLVADYTNAPDRALGLRFLAEEGIFGFLIVPKWLIYATFIIAGLAVRQKINVVWLTMTLFPMLLYGLGLLSLASTGSAGGALVTVYLVFGALSAIVGLRTRWEIVVVNIEYLKMKQVTNQISTELENLKTWRNVLYATMNNIDLTLEEIKMNEVSKAVNRLSLMKESIKDETGVLSGDSYHNDATPDTYTERPVSVYNPNG